MHEHYVNRTMLTFLLTVNVYFQRNPSVSPGDDCPNPPAIVIARCGLYSEHIDAFDASNWGQPRGPPDANGEVFWVAVRGSNGEGISPGSPHVCVLDISLIFGSL